MIFSIVYTCNIIKNMENIGYISWQNASYTTLNYYNAIILLNTDFLNTLPLSHFELFARRLDKAWGYPFNIYKEILEQYPYPDILCQAKLASPGYRFLGYRYNNPDDIEEQLEHLAFIMTIINKQLSVFSYNTTQDALFLLFSA